MQPHLCDPSLQKRARQSITLLRTGAHHLRIETGRWLNLPRDERVCQLCTLGEVEDEPHAVLHCPAFVDLRHKFSASLDFTLMLREFLEQQDQPGLGQFLFELFDDRTELLDNLSMADGAPPTP